MILLCLLLVCWANPARGLFSSVFGVPGGCFFIPLLNSSVLLQNSMNLCRGITLSMCAHLGLSQVISQGRGAGYSQGAAQMECTPFHIGGGGIFWSSFCLSLSLHALSAAEWPHSLFVQGEPGRSPGYRVWASLLWDLLWSCTQHPHSHFDHPACCLPTQAPDAAAACGPPVLPGEVSQDSCSGWVGQLQDDLKVAQTTVLSRCGWGYSQDHHW